MPQGVQSGGTGTNTHQPCRAAAVFQKAAVAATQPHLVRLPVQVQHRAGAPLVQLHMLLIKCLLGRSSLHICVGGTHTELYTQ